MVHDSFRTQTEKIEIEIGYCSRAVAPMLVDTSLMLGHELEKKEITSLEYEEKMEKLKKLSMKFNDECLCIKSVEMMNLIMPKDKKK